MKNRKPTAYDRGQHQLICKALNVSDDPEAPGLTAYEAVCAVMYKLELAEDAIRKTLLRYGTVCTLKAIHDVLPTISKPNANLEFLPCYGTGLTKKNGKKKIKEDE